MVGGRGKEGRQQVPCKEGQEITLGNMVPAGWSSEDQPSMSVFLRENHGICMNLFSQSRQGF